MNNGERLKRSYYNFILDVSDGFILYNSLTGVIISVTDKMEIEKIKEILEKEEVYYDKEDEIIRI